MNVEMISCLYGASAVPYSLSVGLICTYITRQLNRICGLTCTYTCAETYMHTTVQDYSPHVLYYVCMHPPTCTLTDKNTHILLHTYTLQSYHGTKEEPGYRHGFIPL